MKIDRRLFLHFDWILLAIVLAISLIGIMNIYSAGYSLTSEKLQELYIKQLQWLMVGLVLMVLAFSLDYRLFVRHAYTLYLFSVILLILVFFFGYNTRGSQRWIMVLGFTIQPSEIAKITVIIVLARYFSDRKAENGYLLRDLLLPFCGLLVPLVCVVKQPDLGTAFIILIIFLSVCFIAGIAWKSLFFGMTGMLITIPLIWQLMQGYQRVRIRTFLDPGRDPLGTGYQAIQSIIAAGSGGLFGKGFLQGTQTQLKFLPEQQTDFVFSVFAEEWGFMGTALLMILFSIVVLNGLRISYHSKDQSGRLIAGGVTTMILFQAVINIGMVLGVLPVVGIPLPFMSYGGSSMVVCMFGIGLLINVKMRRFVLQSPYGSEL